MSKIYFNFICFALLFLLYQIGCAQNNYQGQFRADLHQKISGKAADGKIFVNADNYRIEITEDGERVNIIVKGDEGNTYIMSPSKKIYKKFKSGLMESMIVDPFQSCKYMYENYDKKSEGTETIGGYACEKYRDFTGDHDIITQWISKKLNFTLKVIYAAPQDRMMELKNIEEMPVDKSLFEIPSDYTKMSNKPEIKIPDWIGDVDKAGFETPPVKKTLKEGNIIKIKIKNGNGIKVVGSNKSKNNSAFLAVSFKDGKPASDPSMRTMNLSYEGQSATFNLDETPFEADEVIVRVREGTVEVDISNYNIPEGMKISSGNEHRFSIAPQENTIVKLVNLNNDESTCVVSFYKKGKKLSDDEAGPLNFRTYYLEEKSDIKKMTYAPDADELAVSVQSGELYVIVFPENK